MSTPAERAAELAAEMKAAAAAKKAAKKSAAPAPGAAPAVPQGPQAFNRENPGHLTMARAADRFVTNSIMARHSPVAARAAEAARSVYLTARKEHGFVEGIEGPCAGAGCPTTHKEGKDFCGGGSCKSGKQLGRNDRRTVDTSGFASDASLPTTTRAKAGPEGRGFGADAGFTTPTRRIE